MAKRMPKEARAAMNRIGMQDPKELERRKKRFRKMAAMYKASDMKELRKSTGKKVAKELAQEAATLAVGGLAGNALSKGGQAAYKAYKVSKAGKATKGAQKALKAGSKQKLLMAPRAQAAKKIAKGLKRPGKKRIHTTYKHRDAPLSTPRTRALETARDGLTKSTEKSIGRLTSTQKFKDLAAGKKRRKGGSADRDVLRRMDDEKQNYLKLKEARKGRKFKLRARTSEARPVAPKKEYKLNTSGKPPAPKPKAKRVKTPRRKPGAPVKQTPSKPVKFDKKSKPYGSTRGNRAVQKTPRGELKKAERSLRSAKGARRSFQRDLNEAQRKGSTEFMRRNPEHVRSMPKGYYSQENLMSRSKDMINFMDRTRLPGENMLMNKARRRVKAGAVKPRRRK